MRNILNMTNIDNSTHILYKPDQKALDTVNSKAPPTSIKCVKRRCRHSVKIGSTRVINSYNSIEGNKIQPSEITSPMKDNTESMCPPQFLSGSGFSINGSFSRVGAAGIGAVADAGTGDSGGSRWPCRRGRRDGGGSGNNVAAAAALLLLVSSTLPNTTHANKEGGGGGGGAVSLPVFLEPIANVTVPAGRDVRLACVVDHLGSYKLAWIQKDRSAILTVGSHVITRNVRIGVTHDGHRTWYLSIKDVRPGDAGTYMCQVNTETVRSQIGIVGVVVPPYIKDDMSSSDVNLVEGAGVTLACSARGSPIPSISWRREDGSHIRINLTQSLLEVPGPLLKLSQVSRTGMGAYLCIASNGVPPSVSKRINVEVKFLPTVYVPHQLVDVPEGESVTLECYIEAWPQGLNYWKRPNGIEILHDDKKYENEEMSGSQKYKRHMLLTIREVTLQDSGEYNCIANNSQGGAQQVVKVSVSPQIPPKKNQNAIEKGYDKDSNYGKPSLSSVNWSKDREEAGPSGKGGYGEIHKSSHQFNSQQQQNHLKRLTKEDILDIPSLESSTACTWKNSSTHLLLLMSLFILAFDH
ncbi:unnamed protein product [Meganyctiphanes norvegica]|uniref:Ig-like domain-containing protein n=1 Tax=Meganyctiphanes norvegica TaxID=48144 RepID=A0AAV2QLG4_MEGNR